MRIAFLRRKLVHLSAVAIIVATAVAGALTPGLASAEQNVATVPVDSAGMPASTYFPPTSHSLSGPLLKAWSTTGLMIIGYPISEPVQENGRAVQYFERSRLEVWPEHAGTKWEVQGTLLGTWLAEQRYGKTRNNPAFNALPDGLTSNTPDRVIFSETRHSLAYGFKNYWDKNGGLWQFGFPISEEFVEDGYTVQYFERARFEFHPENAGTQFEILLGLLGNDYAKALKIPTNPAAQPADAVIWDAGLFSPQIANAFRNGTGIWWGKVSTDAVSVRSAPRNDAPAMDVAYSRHPIVIYAIVKGDVREGTDAWYLTDNYGYVPAVYVAPLVLNPPPQTFGGHWVDVNLSQFYAVAYNGSTPAYVAIITAGRDGKTPLGTFNIQSQVRREIMDSATVGIPHGSSGWYYLENVEYTQYFLAGGYALHGNYWTPESSFGNFTSNGCVGLMNTDAAFFWNWLNIGDVVTIHY